jgi:hypothetical protein
MKTTLTCGSEENFCPQVFLTALRASQLAGAENTVTANQNQNRFYSSFYTKLSLILGLSSAVLHLQAFRFNCTTGC